MRDPGPSAQPRTLDAVAHRIAHAPIAPREMVEEVALAVFTTLHGDLSPKDTGLLAEIEDLARTISAAKSEIAALRVDDINASHIPSATDELDAIVSHTAAATNSILEVCEKLDLLAGTIGGEASTTLGDATTGIYEACSFQDITGQRISKVVTTLKTIEIKVAQILAAFGDPNAVLEAEPVFAEGDEAALLNGPQLPMTAMDQSDIDALLASF